MFDLFGEESESTVAEMNTKFETYGVNIKSPSFSFRGDANRKDATNSRGRIAKASRSRTQMNNIE